MRELDKEMIRQRRAHEATLRKSLESLLLQVPTVPLDRLGNLQIQIDVATQKLQNLEAVVVAGHKLRAGLKWEADGDRLSAFFF